MESRLEEVEEGGEERWFIENDNCRQLTKSFDILVANTNETTSLLDHSTFCHAAKEKTHIYQLLIYTVRHINIEG